MEIKKHLTFFVGIIVVFGFILGWIFPVEGPIDYVYDNYKAKKHIIAGAKPSVTVPELTEEELEFIDEMLKELFNGNKGEDE